ncbi:unannotated protein [freshwater metagenome]|uniref:Unannotated protein n=1 Tax=freshwater metagenome TaxID=449393 RepID=A0A6J7LUZ7_9ZZZZ
MQQALVPIDVIAAGVNDIPPEMFMLWIGGMIFVFVIVPAIVAAMKSDPEPAKSQYRPPGKSGYVRSGALVTRGPMGSRNKRVHIAYILSDGRVATHCDTFDAYTNDGFIRPAPAAMSVTCKSCAKYTAVKSEHEPRDRRFEQTKSRAEEVREQVARVQAEKWETENASRDPRAHGKRAFSLGSDDYDKDGNPVAKRKKPKPPRS